MCTKYLAVSIAVCPIGLKIGKCGSVSQNIIQYGMRVNHSHYIDFIPRPCLDILCEQVRIYVTCARLLRLSNRISLPQLKTHYYGSHESTMQFLLLIELNR